MSDYLKESIALFGRMKQIRGTDANALSETSTANWQPEVTVPGFYIGDDNDPAIDESGVRCAKCHGFRNGREHQRSSPYFTHSFIPDWEGDNSVAAQGQ